MSFGGPLVPNTRFRDLTRDFLEEVLIRNASAVVRGEPTLILDVAVPCGLALHWWKVHACDSVPLGNGQLHNLVCDARRRNYLPDVAVPSAWHGPPRSAFAIREWEEHCVCKHGMTLVSGLVSGQEHSLVGHSCGRVLWDTLVGHSCGTLKSAPQECPKRVSYKSVKQCSAICF